MCQTQVAGVTEGGGGARTTPEADWGPGRRGGERGEDWAEGERTGVRAEKPSRVLGHRWSVPAERSANGRYTWSSDSPGTPQCRARSPLRLSPAPSLSDIHSGPQIVRLTHQRSPVRATYTCRSPVRPTYTAVLKSCDLHTSGPQFVRHTHAGPQFVQHTQRSSNRATYTPAVPSSCDIHMPVPSSSDIHSGPQIVRHAHSGPQFDLHTQLFSVRTPHTMVLRSSHTVRSLLHSTCTTRSHHFSYHHGTCPLRHYHKYNYACAYIMVLTSSSSVLISDLGPRFVPSRPVPSSLRGSRR